MAHLLAAPLPATSVQGLVDWPRRFDHMQQHTGQHLLSAVFIELLNAETVSVHFGAESSTLDLDVGRGFCRGDRRRAGPRQRRGRREPPGDRGLRGCRQRTGSGSRAIGAARSASSPSPTRQERLRRHACALTPARSARSSSAVSNGSRSGCAWISSAGSARRIGPGPTTWPCHTSPPDSPRRSMTRRRLSIASGRNCATRMECARAYSRTSLPFRPVIASLQRLQAPQGAASSRSTCRMVRWRPCAHSPMPSLHMRARSSSAQAMSPRRCSSLPRRPAASMLAPRSRPRSPLAADGAAAPHGLPRAACHPARHCERP